MSLLIGASGVGKSSLLHAGLVPRVAATGLGGRDHSALTNPMDNLRRSLWLQTLEGTPPDDSDFTSVVSSAAIAHAPSHLLVVIDQFEDILGAEASKDRAPLTQALLQLCQFSPRQRPYPGLLPWRRRSGDRVHLQDISGSPEGFPRQYVGPLTRDTAEEALRANLEALGVKAGKECRPQRRLIARIAD